MGNISIWEKLRLGILWGTDLTSWDMDKYALYYAMYNVSQCDFYTTYDNYFFALSFILLGYAPMSGWLTDYTEDYQHLTLSISVAIQTITYVFQMSDFITDYNSLMAVWIIRQVAIYQSQTSVWKVVKLRLEVLQSDAEKLDEISVIINRIGNFGDIMSDSYEIIFLGIASISPLLYPGFGNDQAKHTIYVAVLILNVACLALSLSFTKSQLRKPKPKSVEMTSSGELANSGEMVMRKSFGVYFKEWLIFTKLRVQYYWRNRVAFHSLNHYLIFLVFYTIVAYPITLSASNELSINTPQHDAVCDGLIANLLTQGFILNIVYLITTFMYTATLVKCPPYQYYRWVFHIKACALAICVGVLWVQMTEWPTFIMVSLAQAIPYYVQSFNFYTFTSSIDEVYYGFVYSIYGFLYQLMYIIPASILYAPYTNESLIIASEMLIGLAMVYAVWISINLKDELQAKPPPAEVHGAIGGKGLKDSSSSPPASPPDSPYVERANQMDDL